MAEKFSEYPTSEHPMADTFSSALFVVRGQDQGRRFNLDSSSVTIGRHGSNDIQLFDGKASRKHARLVFEGSRHKLFDLGSSNGTFVNECRIDQCVLVNGDKISIGGTILLFSQGVSLHEPHTEQSPTTGLGEMTGDAPSQISKIIRADSFSQSESLSRIFSSNSEIGVAKTQEKLRILYSASLEHSTSFDLDELLQRMLDLIFQLLRIDLGCILVLGDGKDPSVKACTCKSRQGFSSESTEQIKQLIPRQILQRVLESNEGVLGLRHNDSISGGGSVQIICAPMMGQYGRVGTIYVESRGMPETDAAETAEGDEESSQIFDESHVEILLAIGRQAGRAIEEKIFSAAMIHSERMAAMGETVAMMSHQIKNIMQGMGGAGFMIKEGLANDDKQVIQRGWEILDRNQQRISDLIMNMLSFSKDRKPSFQRADIVKTALDVIEMATAYAGEHGVELEKELPDKLELYFDEEMVSRAMLNVLLNAIDACGDGGRSGRVKLMLKQVESECAIHISDNGVGIPSDDLEKIFSPFRSSKGGRGTGLGLTIARKNCQEHGGRLQVESQENVGSTFSLFLPIWSDLPIAEHGAADDGDASITRIHKKS